MVYTEDDDDYVHVAHGDAEMSAHSSSGTGMDSPLPAVAALAASAATPTQGSPGLDFKKVLEHRKLMEQAVKLWKAKPKNAVKVRYIVTNMTKLCIYFTFIISINQNQNIKHQNPLSLLL